MNGHDWRHLEHVLGTLTSLVNSAPPAAAADELNNVEALKKFVLDRVITEVEEPTTRDVEPMHKVRAQIRAVFVAPDEPSRTTLVNRLLASARIVPRLSDHDGFGLHLHYFPSFATIEEHLIADGGMALAAVLTAGESDRLKVCGAPDCARVMVDSSRNRSRNFCDSGRCGNRVNAAAYRERQRVSPTS
ncbi:MAG: CGNR zinc finger domain-containing protein [Salinibacterium sp.]|nr:CGNR zinc finger domain-containing protein [Salinibacterium sp.]